MKIGIICAADDELLHFISMLKNQTITEKAMLKIYTGTIENMPVVALFCGVCKTNAAVATQILIDTYSCHIIINAGTAGGIDERLQILDTVVSTEVAHWDVADGILTKYHPWAENIFFKSNEMLIKKAKTAIEKNEFVNVHFGRTVTGEAFIEDNFRDEIKNKYAPLSVDMESASIAQTCYVNQVPFIVVRSITDTAEHCGQDAFAQNCEKASQKSADIVRAVLREISIAEGMV